MCLHRADSAMLPDGGDAEGAIAAAERSRAIVDRLARRQCMTC